MQEIKWFGNVGHFCRGQWCRFHLTTLVNGFLISTIGEYVHPRHSNGCEAKEAAWLKDNWPGEEIGYGRKYETMVFKAEKLCDSPKCGCDMPVIDGLEIDAQGYNTANEATEGHMFLIDKYKNENAPQNIKESAQHSHQHSNGTEPTEICPHCVDGVRTVHEVSRTYKEGCFECGGTGKLRHC